MEQGGAPRISVVLATHNGERFLETQLQSVMAQTLAPFELILADDASTDGTIKLARRSLSGCGFPVEICANPRRLGFRDNFLHASLRVRGEFVAFCDQDDVWHPEKLARCAAMMKDDVNLIVHRATLVDARGRRLGLLRQGIRKTVVRPPLSYDPWETFLGFSMVFRRQLLSLTNIEDRFSDFIVPGERIAHDRWVMFLSQMVGRTAEIAAELTQYRQHDANLFGGAAYARPAAIASIPERNACYINATCEMLGVLERLAPGARRSFRLFDEDRCRAFLEEALAQLEARARVYQSRSRLTAATQICRALTRGEYLRVHDRSLRWRSVARDIQVAIQ